MIRRLWYDTRQELKKTQTQLYVSSFVFSGVGLGLGFTGHPAIAIPLLLGGIGACIAGVLSPHI